MRGISFGWFAVWVPNPDWLCRILEECDVCQGLGWSRRAWGRGVRAVPRLCIEYPGICLTTEENHGTVRVTEWRSAVRRRTRFVLSTWPSRAMAWTGLLSPAALGLHVRLRGLSSIVWHLSAHCRCTRLVLQLITRNDIRTSSAGLLRTRGRPVTETSHNTTIKGADIRAPGRIRTRNPSKPAAALDRAATEIGQLLRNWF